MPTSTTPNQYFTPTFSPDMSQETATHFRQLYLATNQHDEAIKLVHSMASTTTTIEKEVTTVPTNPTVIPGNTLVVAHEFITAYDSTSGAFSQAQPGFPDISGPLALAQLPSAGISITIVTAALTLGGTQGSMIFTGGLLTSQTPAT